MTNKATNPEDAVKPETRRKFLEALREMREQIHGAGNVRQRTARDYRSGQPRHNAELLIELSDWTFREVDDEGIFCEKNSAGTFRFRTLVNLLKETDIHHRLTTEDAEEAVAMLFHLVS